MADAFLLDTHIWLWMNQDPDRLGKKTRELLEDPESRLILSVASCWEMAIKSELGKLSLPSAPGRYIKKRAEDNQVEIAPIESSHVFASVKLPRHHKDPFDRLLVAKAKLEKWTLVTVDSQIKRYEVALHWGED